MQWPIRDVYVDRVNTMAYQRRMLSVWKLSAQNARGKCWYRHVFLNFCTFDNPTVQISVNFLSSSNSYTCLTVPVCRLKKVFLVSGSQDCTIKVWELPDSLPAVGCEPALMTARLTEKAHDKVGLCPRHVQFHSRNVFSKAVRWTVAENMFWQHMLGFPSFLTFLVCPLCQNHCPLLR